MPMAESDAPRGRATSSFLEEAGSASSSSSSSSSAPVRTDDMSLRELIDLALFKEVVPGEDPPPPPRWLVEWARTSMQGVSMGILAGGAHHALSLPPLASAHPSVYTRRSLGISRAAMRGGMIVGGFAAGWCALRQSVHGELARLRPGIDSSPASAAAISSAAAGGLMGAVYGVVFIGGGGGLLRLARSGSIGAGVGCVLCGAGTLLKATADALLPPPPEPVPDGARGAGGRRAAPLDSVIADLEKRWS